MKITVYSKPSCIQCDATKRSLTKYDLAYMVIDVTKDLVALAKIKALGYLQAPVVIVEMADGTIRHWSGFKPDKIKRLFAEHQLDESSSVMAS